METEIQTGWQGPRPWQLRDVWAGLQGGGREYRGAGGEVQGCRG